MNGLTKELLELAARAAGEVFTHHLVDGVQGKRKGPFVVRRQRWTQWNPLTDDGDALRLAAKLSIGLRWCKSGRVYAYQGDVEECESSREDRQANLRHVIVRVAAEIGRTMGKKI